MGSTRSVLDVNGNIKEALDYYPFGLLMPGRVYQSGSGAKEKFTGKERDSETGLDYFGARYYWPAGGRWWSVDQRANKTPFITPYQYARNDPLLCIDPDGREDREAMFFAGLRIATGATSYIGGTVMIIDGAIGTGGTSGLALPVGLAFVAGGLATKTWGAFEFAAGIADYKLAANVPDGQDAQALGNVVWEISQGLGIDKSKSAIISVVASVLINGTSFIGNIKRILEGKSLPFLLALLDEGSILGDTKAAIRTFVDEMQKEGKQSGGKNENNNNQDKDEKDDEYKKKKQKSTTRFRNWDKYDASNGNL